MPFTPINTSLGALLLYQGSYGLLQNNGRVFGISSLLSGCVGNPNTQNVPVILGMVSSIVPVYLLAPSLLPPYATPPATWGAALALAGIGFLVGWGTKNGNGCTSGHMLCGISRISPRSFIATGIFFITALVTANLGIGATVSPPPDGRPAYLPVYPSIDEVAFMFSTVAISQAFNSFLVPALLPRYTNSNVVYSCIAGLQFGLGLLITGMANPEKVLGFFHWFDPAKFDPSLALVMVFGVGPSLLSYLYMKTEYGNEDGMKPPLLADRFSLPTATIADIDWRFVVGCVAFGIGWGLSGVCPGPGLLRSALSPLWGAPWLAGFWLGSLLGI
ncbi:TPA_exp: Uncharacterized protein A8136_1230 [Trichophyton benhamiae CBS 112371]|nr:TPA_exp: Uncharacterized protein A8136_1230 [Trichophyton benhamiae CBS 112371]